MILRVLLSHAIFVVCVCLQRWGLFGERVFCLPGISHPQHRCNSIKFPPLPKTAPQFETGKTSNPKFGLLYIDDLFVTWCYVS